jgi:GNAT superfamily N-acetyltransferase
MRLIDVTDSLGAVVEPAWLQRAEGVHRQLRATLPADYAGRLAQVFANGGRLAVAAEGESVAGVALWRLENTYEGRRLYVDDLVTDEAQRSRGVGKALLAIWKTRRGRSAATCWRSTPARSGRRRTNSIFARGFAHPRLLLQETLK